MAVVGLEAAIKTRRVIARTRDTPVAEPGTEVAQLRPEGEVDPGRVAAASDARQAPAVEAIMADVDRSPVQAGAVAGRRRR